MSGLRATISELLKKADQWGSDLNEANTKALLIEPLLAALGWDVYDLDTVTREYRVYDNTLIDYALKVGGKPRLFVEAKPLKRSLDDKQFIAQTVNYANNEGVVWCVLTNGLQYRVYKTNEPLDMENKLLIEVDLKRAEEDAGADDVVGALAYLSRESIEAGGLDDLGERKFTDERVRSALVALLTDPPSAFLKAIAERTGGREAPARRRIRESLRRLAIELGGDQRARLPGPPAASESRGEARAPSRAAAAAPERSGAARWVSLDRLEPSPFAPPPAQLRRPDGSTRELRSWKDLLVEVARHLVKAGALTAAHCPLATSRSRYLIHTEAVHPSGKPFFAPVRAGALWLETHAAARDIARRSNLLIRAGGGNPRDYQVLVMLP